MKQAALFVLVLSSLGSCATSRGERMYPSFEDALAALHGSTAEWRLGTRADCTNPFLGDMLAGNPRYEPYRVAADLNRDGRTDHAFVLIKGDSGRVYWLEANDQGFVEPRLLAQLDWIREGGLVALDDRLLFGRFYSDVSIVWRWEPTTRQLEPVAEEEGRRDPIDESGTTEVT